MATDSESVTRKVSEIYAAWLSRVPGERVTPTSVECVLELAREEIAKLQGQRASGELTQEALVDRYAVVVLTLRKFHTANADAEIREPLESMSFELLDNAPELPHPKYRFTQNYVGQHESAWLTDLAPIIGAPNVRALEVGSFEGRSAMWMLENILTHPTSTLTCVDTFAWTVGNRIIRKYDARFDHNLAQCGHGHRVSKLVGPSPEVLRYLPRHRFDFAYIDGSHFTVGVMDDALRAWPLVKPGGIIIFDDYGMGASCADGYESRAPAAAIDAFLEFVASESEVMRRGWQLTVRKTR